MTMAKIRAKVKERAREKAKAECENGLYRNEDMKVQLSNGGCSQFYILRSWLTLGVKDFPILLFFFKFHRLKKL